jgi:hypothetical protein
LSAFALLTLSWVGENLPLAGFRQPVRTPTTASEKENIPGTLRYILSAVIFYTLREPFLNETANSPDLRSLTLVSQQKNFLCFSFVRSGTPPPSAALSLRRRKIFAAFFNF